MKKFARLYIVLFITLGIIGLWACEKKETPPPAPKAETAKTEQAPPAPAAEAPALPAAEGLAVMNYITKENPYQNWDLWPGKEKLYPGREPHGSFLTTYVSPPALKAIQDKAGKMPDNAIIVKENYSPEKQLAAVTVMYKKAEYNPDGGDWFWLKYTTDGNIAAEGKVEGCLNCHGQQKDNDYLWTEPIQPKTM